MIATSGGFGKQYGVARLHLGHRLALSVFVSPDRRELDADALAAIGRHPGPVDVVDDADLASVARRLSRMDVAVGNDTGLSHLAAMTVSQRTGRLLPTAIVYLRMDPSEWTTGGSNVRALTSPFARLLAATAMPPHVAGVHPAWGRHAKPESASENTVLNAVQNILIDAGLL